MDSMLTSLREKVLPLADDTVVLPGHGPATTIGASAPPTLTFANSARKRRPAVCSKGQSRKPGCAPTTRPYVEES